MNTDDSSSRVIVLLGAGFNADAKLYAGPIYGHSIYIGRHEIQCGYPLACDLARVCFGFDQPPSDRSIEDLFQGSLETGDLEPIRRLANIFNLHVSESSRRPGRLVHTPRRAEGPLRSSLHRFALHTLHQIPFRPRLSHTGTSSLSSRA